MTGFLVSPGYHAPAPDPDDMYIASIVWGFCIASSIFTAVKAIQQSSTSWKRSRRVSPYIVMVWLEWLASVLMGIFCWFFLRGTIKPSFQLFFSLVCMWVVQIQMLTQIIINRISLLSVRRSVAIRLKWTVAIILGLINISVFVIWIPARLQISETWIHVNEIWDRAEKVVFALIDGSLNAYFIYLVRTKLIENGLTKYMPLFWFNIMMIFISLSLDIILIGMMSLRNGFVYVQFHPLVYLVKLHIEMNNADLIIKIVKVSNRNNQVQGYGMNRTSEAHRSQPGAPQEPAGKHQHRVRERFTADAKAYAEISSNGPNGEPIVLNGIQKTISTTVTSKWCEDDEMVSESSSTRQLKT
ncbi:hypothetical protein DM02DRAFT_612114 [Periconia macrospinosa]|uniref:Integral membrane protein n=1 Tax=Periconia macrospinosa TaxID=97972 RepID=A0A2V1E3A2_9PLEO|nr:hypothetical protein DM02DRAFT_612114 [Periconia macrospinosa]